MSYSAQAEGKYYIVHFKELFALDGKDPTFLKTTKQEETRLQTC